MKNVKSISVVTTIPPLVVCLISPFCLAGFKVVNLLGGQLLRLSQYLEKNRERKVGFKEVLFSLATSVADLTPHSNSMNVYKCGLELPRFRLKLNEA